MNNVIMKLSLYLLICFFSGSVFASISFSELQTFTNKILIADNNLVRAKDLPKYINILKSSTNAITDSKIIDEVNNAKKYTNSYLIAKELDEEPPSVSIPKLFALIEASSLVTNKYSFYGGMYTNSLRDWVYMKAANKLDIATKIKKDSITMLWLPESTYILSPKNMVFIWYYIGLKALPLFWEDWYVCWSKENSKKEPRVFILKKLVKEITGQFSYHIFPFIADAIENGDASMVELLNELSNTSFGHNYSQFSFNTSNLMTNNYEIYKYGIDQQSYTNCQSFLKWWKENRVKYEIPLPNYSIKDVKYMFREKNVSSVFNEETYKMALEAEDALKQYMALKNRPVSNYWYYSIENAD